MNNSLHTGLLEFLAPSPSPFHAARNLSKLFLENGFEQLDEKAEWAALLDAVQEGERAYLVQEPMRR